MPTREVASIITPAIETAIKNLCKQDIAKSLWKTKKFVKLDPVGMCDINICAYVLLTYVLETTINESWHKFINSKAPPRSGKDTLEGQQRMLDQLAHL